MRLSKSFAWVVVVTSLVLITACDSSAQAPGGRRGGGRFGRGGMGGPGLLAQKSIQEELKLTPQQITDATKLNEEQRDARREIFNADESKREALGKELTAKSDAALAKILSTDQVKRFDQIRLQLRGVQAFTTDELAKTLSLTDDQRKQIEKIDDERASAMEGLFGNRGDGNRTDSDREAARKKITDANKAALDKVTAVLTADQKKIWEEKTGTPFKGEITFGGGGGVGGRRNRN